MSVSTGALTVRETGDNLEKIERVLEEFDVPSLDARLHFQLIRADGASGRADPAIASVVEELGKIFRFQGYQLMGEAFVTAGEGEISQSFSGIPYMVTAQTVPMQPGMIKLSRLELWDGPSSRILTTSVTVRGGQTLVLGSAPSSQGEGAVILTVRAEAPEGEGR